MVDNLTPEQRRRAMAANRGRDTRPEVRLRSLLHRRGLRFRKNDSGLPGRPDVVFPSARLAVFVDGDFWHGRTLVDGDVAGFERQFARTERGSWWEAKIRRTVERDRVNNSALEAAGWCVMRVWARDLARDDEAIADRIAHVVAERCTPSRRPRPADTLLSPPR